MVDRAIQGRLILSPDYVLFVGTGLRARTHRHLSASVTLSLDHAFEVRTKHGVSRARIMLVRPDTEHALEAQHARLINLQLDPETDLYARLREGALRERELLLHEEVDEGLLSALRVACAEDSVPAQRLVDTLLSRFGAAQASTRFDARVAQALEVLKASFPDAPSSELIAKRVGASESRLMHLFREQVGVPLRRYMLWLRLRHLLFCVALGDNITMAAHAAGFADSAHFARVFSSMFGVTPSSLLRSERVARAVVLPSVLRGPHAAQDIERIRELVSRSRGIDAAS